MTDFDDEFAAEALPDLMEEFGEQVIYRPLNGEPRTITAMVIRSAAQKEGNRGVQTRLRPLFEGGPVGPHVIIEAYNDEKTGIASGLLDKGGDKIDVAIVKGGEVSTREITELISDIAGMTTILVR